MQTTQSFYVSTAINYTNGSPHVGHAYEVIAADVIARYQRALGKDVFFTTGADEHGQKVAESAERAGLTPIQLCDKYVDEFQSLNTRLMISNDWYARTTTPKHHETSQWLWTQAAKKGDIYLGTYEGWYNVREEQFVTEKEAKANDYKDPVSLKPLVKTKEPSYFFKMGNYQQVLIDHINTNETFIIPSNRKAEILERLKEPLQDLSVSRTTFDWGIAVPSVEGQESPAEKHIMYVWFDALTNYLTSVDYATKGDLSRFWPCDLHVIGKDISWFHCVIWPCVLLSCGIPLPKSVLCHGFVLDENQRKMSKSLGNVVEPNALLDKFPAEAFRYFCVREGTFGGDCCYSEKALLNYYDSELGAKIGNLVSRATQLCEQHCGGIVPDCEVYQLFDAGKLIDDFLEKLSSYSINEAIFLVLERFNEVNLWLTQKAPWHMKGDESLLPEIQKIVKTAMEAVYILCHFIYPVTPSLLRVYDYFHTPPKFLAQINRGWDNLVPGTKVDRSDAIYPRIQLNRYLRKQDKPAAQPAAAAAGRGNAQPQGVATVDFRVGKILECSLHPENPRLYVEKIDVGEAAPRQVVSGLAEHIPLEKMIGSPVIVVCNMKPTKFKGVESAAMVLAASSDASGLVRLVAPPEGCPVGERIAVEGYNTLDDAHPPILNPKKKEWEKVKPDLSTNAEGIACYKGIPLSTSVGPLSCPELPSCPLG